MDSGYAESHAPLGVVKPRGLKNGPCAERRGLDTSQPDDACRAGIETVTKHHFSPSFPLGKRRRSERRDHEARCRTRHRTHLTKESESTTQMRPGANGLTTCSVEFSSEALERWHAQRRAGQQLDDCEASAQCTLFERLPELAAALHEGAMSRRQSHDTRKRLFHQIGDRSDGKAA